MSGLPSFDYIWYVSLNNLIASELIVSLESIGHN